MNIKITNNDDTVQVASWRDIKIDGPHSSDMKKMSFVVEAGNTIIVKIEYHNYYTQTFAITKESIQNANLEFVEVYIPTLGINEK